MAQREVSNSLDDPKLPNQLDCNAWLGKSVGGGRGGGEQIEGEMLEMKWKQVNFFSTIIFFPGL